MISLSHRSPFLRQTTLTGELGARIEMTAVINKNRIRHGHMVNINRQIMVEGMRADFIAIDALEPASDRACAQEQTHPLPTPHGTEFEAEFSPKLKWLKTSGLITPEKWGNLPGGEIFTSPKNM